MAQKTLDARTRMEGLELRLWLNCHNIYICMYTMVNACVRLTKRHAWNFN